MPLFDGLFAADILPTDAPTRVPVVLIHGAGGSHLDWPASVRRLKSARTLAIDLPGHGKSPGPGRDRVAAYAADVLRLLDQLHLERALWLGHSMGGAIAQTLALDHPDRTAALMLTGSGARLRVAPAILDGIQKDYQATARLIVDWSWAPATPQPARDGALARLLTVEPRVTAGDFGACDRFDVMERIAGVHTPTLIIVGSEDRMTPPRYSEFLAAKIAGSQLTVIPGGGHMVMLEQPDVFGKLVEDWLAGHAA